MLQKLYNDLSALKEQQINSEYQFQRAITSDSKQRERLDVQSEDLAGLHIATVVDTQDPLKQGRVRFYTPYFDLDQTTLEGLPWAAPISPFGGFDDSGAIWVPPAGSKIAVLFLHGSRDAAFYFGTIWYRNRGAGNHLDQWGYPIPEYDCLWEGRRNGYMFGSNAGDQVLPPWNTEMYNGYDTDSITDFYSDPSQYNSTTYPYIKGFKTEEKHMLKFVEGDPRCNRRWKRVELASGRGNWLMLKDDHLHAAGQWGFGSGAGAYCHQTKQFDSDPDSILDIPKEYPCCGCDNGEPARCVPTQCAPKFCPTKCETHGSVDRDSKFINPFYKRFEEMRPHYGANTPQANRCELDQTGVQLQSMSGHQLVLDDSVNQPAGYPSWDRDFDFGCDDTARCKMWMKSATGHLIELNDEEDVGLSKVRGENNSINFRSASGNFFEMNDHTIESGPCTPEYAGDRRGFTMMSTSTHLFQMNDNHLKQHSPIRAEGGAPKQADESGFEGYILLRSGYGLQLLMKDQDRQDKTVNQFIQLMAPQIDNKERGPHMLVMQEQPSGPGLVLMRAGGVYYQASYDETVEVTGVEENPASRFTAVTDSWLVDVENVYFNHNDLTVYWADQYIFLMAGADCPPPPDQAAAASQSQSQQDEEISKAQGNPGSTDGKSQCSPCLYNVIVSKDPWVCPFTGYVHFGVYQDLDSRSQRVFASATQPSGSKGCAGGEG